MMNKKITIRKSIALETVLKEATRQPLLTVEQEIEVEIASQRVVWKIIRNYRTGIIVLW